MVFVEKIIIAGKSVDTGYLVFGTVEDFEIILSNGDKVTYKNICELSQNDVVGVSEYGYDFAIVTYDKREQYLFELFVAGEANADCMFYCNGVVFANMRYYNIFDAYKEGKLRFPYMTDKFRSELSKYCLLG